jgi:hypothetical protein
VINISIYPQKFVAWSFFGLLPPSHFNTPLEGIKVLGVPFNTLSFKSSFTEDTLLKDI